MDQDKDGFHFPFYHTPKWLDIESQLYPQTTMSKRFILQNPTDGLFQEFYAEVTYLSKSREIDITRALSRAIRKNYQDHSDSQVWSAFPQNNKEQFNPDKIASYNFTKPATSLQTYLNSKFRILYYDEDAQNFYSLGQYPFDDKPILLGQQFLDMDLITIKLETCNQYQIYNSHTFEYCNQKYTKGYEQNCKSRSYGSYQSYINDQQYVTYNNSDYTSSGNAKERSIKQVLEKLGEWRRTYHQNKKMSLEDSAKQIKIPKRTLDDYYLQVKLAEKYGFNFEKNQNEGMGILRKFVKGNHNSEKKKDEPLKILAKFKNNKNK